MALERARDTAHVVPGRPRDWLAIRSFLNGFSSTGCVVCRCHDSGLHACVKTRGNLRQQTWTAPVFFSLNEASQELMFK